MRHLRIPGCILGAAISCSPLAIGQTPARTDPATVRSANQPSIATESAVPRTAATRLQINVDRALASNSINGLVQLHKQPDQPSAPCNSCHSISPTGSGGAATLAVTPDPAVVSKTLLDAILNLCPGIKARLPAREAGKTLWNLVELRAEILKELTKPGVRGTCGGP